MMRMRETMAERPESMKDVPEMRLRGDDVSHIMEFYACWDSLEKLASDPDFCRRVKLIPGGLRDLKMLRSKISKLADDLAWTIPQEKVVGFMRTLKRMRYSVVQGPLASKPKGNDEELVTTHELDDWPPPHGSSAVSSALTATVTAASWGACWTTSSPVIGTAAAGA